MVVEVELLESGCWRVVVEEKWQKTHLALRPSCLPLSTACSAPKTAKSSVSFCGGVEVENARVVSPC